MSYDYSIPIPLLRFLGTCIFGDAKVYYLGLSEGERSELEKQGRSFGLTAWFYRYLYDVLPKEKYTEYQKFYLARQIKAMMGGTGAQTPLSRSGVAWPSICSNQGRGFSLSIIS